MGKVNPTIDWPALKMLFITGVSYRDLAAQTGIPLGTITSRGSREAWAADKKRVQAFAAKSLETAQTIQLSLKERGAQWPSRTANQTDKAMKVLEHEEPETLSQVDRFIGIVDKIDKVARRTYGLDEEGSQQQTIVNLAFLENYPDGSEPQ